MALTDKLTNIANAIREKTGSSDSLTLDQMPTAIASITTGGSGITLPPEAYVVSNECSNLFAYDRWKWYIDLIGKDLRTENLYNINSMFQGCSYTNLPFTLNCSPDMISGADYIFQGCNNLEALPPIKNLRPWGLSGFMNDCRKIVSVPDDYTSTWNWTEFENSTDEWSCGLNDMFRNCCSLRVYPRMFHEHVNKYQNPDQTLYNNAFCGCKALQEVRNLPVPYTEAPWYNNAFSCTFENCNSLKGLTFETNSDGSPIIVQWANQIIDLSWHVGWFNYDEDGGVNYESNITSYGLNLTDNYNMAERDNRHDEGRWTYVRDLSRYAREEAEATIASLPDASSFAQENGMNIIRFDGYAGSSLYDSSGNSCEIRTLSDYYINLAASKGWEVHFGFNGEDYT